MIDKNLSNSITMANRRCYLMFLVDNILEGRGYRPLDIRNILWGKVEKKILSQLFTLSNEQINCVNGTEHGTGLIRFSEKIVPFSNQVDSDSKLYQFFDTNFPEQFRRMKD